VRAAKRGEGRGGSREIPDWFRNTLMACEMTFRASKAVQPDLQVEKPTKGNIYYNKTPEERKGESRDLRRIVFGFDFLPCTWQNGPKEKNK